MEKKKVENIRRWRISFFFGTRKTEKEKKEHIWRRSLHKLSRILRSLGFGLGPETFANFWRVSVLHLVSEKCLGFGFGEFGLGKKVSVSVMGEFGFGIDFGQSFGIVI